MDHNFLKFVNHFSKILENFQQLLTSFGWISHIYKTELFPQFFKHFLENSWEFLEITNRFSENFPEISSKTDIIIFLKYQRNISEICFKFSNKFTKIFQLFSPQFSQNFINYFKSFLQNFQKIFSKILIKSSYISLKFLQNIRRLFKNLSVRQPMKFWAHVCPLH